MASGTTPTSTVAIELRVQVDRALADIRKAEAPVRRALANLERDMPLRLGAGADGFAAGIGAGGGKAAAAKLAGVAAIIAAVDTSLSQFAGAFKDPANRNRSTAGVAAEAVGAASGAIVLETPIVGRFADAVTALIDHSLGAKPGEGYLDRINKDRAFIRSRAESVRALEPWGGAVPDRFSASTPFGSFIAGSSSGNEVTALLRQIAEATKATAVSNRTMQKDSASFR